MVGFALLAVNSAYLFSVSTAGRLTGEDQQTVFSLWMFLVHVAVGLALAIPFLWFGVRHFALARPRPNRTAQRLGTTAFIAGIATLITGVLLLRVDGWELPSAARALLPRSGVVWMHVIAPIVLVWMFLLHRLAGPRIRWRMGGGLLLLAVCAGGLGFVLHGSLTGRQRETMPVSGASYFEPSLARTDSGGFIPASSLMQNEECLVCHSDVHAAWSRSAHAASSFNNPLYAFSVRKTREHAMAHDGSVQDARFCAGCHDPVPFFSGAFEDAKWDDPSYDAAHDPVGRASITCNACHAITALGSPRGNADYVIGQPAEYPFAGSSNPFLRWVNHQLIRARPALHKRTFLKPEVHRTTEFCGACHKVNLPEALNDYRWLRGQNHYDSFRLSGVSGFGAQSWYYPARAETNCNGCHMQPQPSSDPSAKPRGTEGVLAVLNHGFHAGNPATPVLSDLCTMDEVLPACEAFNEGVMRVDVFGIRDGGEIDGALTAPLAAEGPALVRGRRYLIETIVRTLRMGHEFTQGTADSNEVWLDVEVHSAGRIVGRSGGIDDVRRVDPWSKFLIAYVIDREGNRIERRNPEDIFVTLYNHQVPPGAADLTHFALQVPADAGDSLRVRVSLRYRKFDATYWTAAYGSDSINPLPAMTLASDEVTFAVVDAPSGDAPAPLGGAAGGSAVAAGGAFPEWQRWHDYGIGLFRQGERGGSKGDLRQADAAFAEVERLGRVEGTVARGRVALREGRLDDASSLLRAASSAAEPAYPWTVHWFSALVNRQQGALQAARLDLESLVRSAYPLAIERGFDFAKDDRVLLELGNVLLEQATAAERGGAGGGESPAALRQRALALADSALALDPESVPAWYLRAQAARNLGDDATADRALERHAFFKVDENARDRAVRLARERDAAANHAAEAIVIYDLQRSGRFEGSIAQMPRMSRADASADVQRAPFHGTATE
jgi:tetratricopeptide (TPR) repeat protein/cytochrome c553